jgi:hypothetical protein
MLYSDNRPSNLNIATRVVGIKIWFGGLSALPILPAAFNGSGFSA